MPPLNLGENSEKVIEINHHLVHLNTHHYNDWTNPRDIFSTLLYHHAPGSAAGHYGQFPSSQDSIGGLLGRQGHHHHNETHLGNTTPGAGHHNNHTPPNTIIDEAEEESLIVVYALFLPLLAALIFILIVALYVRRMRRSTSAQNVQMQNEVYDFSLQQMKGSKTSSSPTSNHSNNSSNSSTKNQPPRSSSVKTGKGSSSKTKSIYLTRSISSMGLGPETPDHNNQNGLIREPEDKYNQYYYQLQQLQSQQQAGKRWNTSGFLNTNGNNSSDEDCSNSSADNYGYSGSSSSGSSTSGGSRSGIEIQVPRSDYSHIVLDIGQSSPPNGTGTGAGNHQHLELKRSSSGASSTSPPRTSFKTIGGRVMGIINIPKRIRQNNMEKKRFNIYTIPLETREQLKQIYVY